MISVVIPIRNAMPWLEEQVNALVAQVCPEEWEVILADNGSTDGSLEFARRWSADHPQFRLINASERHGAPSARNIGVQEANGDLLAFCDADDVVLPGWLEACVAALRRADVVAGYFDFWSLNGAPQRSPVPAAIRQLGFLPAGLGANLAVRRDAFDRVFGFNEEPLPGEDIDLCWRLQLQGFRFATAPHAVVAKRERSDFRLVMRQGYSYGRCGPMLFRRYRRAGAHRDLGGAIKAWGWVAYSLPRLRRPKARSEWARIVGMRVGRLRGSLEERVFFP
jgi:glycosyltransferase involved in cell wall biosynthesis